MRNGTEECPHCHDVECCSDEEWTDGECAHPENEPPRTVECLVCGTPVTPHDARCWVCGTPPGEEAWPWAW